MQVLQLSGSSSKSRPKPFAFRPPKPRGWVLAIFKALLPDILKNKLKVTDVEISDEDIAKLQALKGKRCILMPSHSGGFEPYIILYLSRLMKDFYYFLAAIEAFQVSWITGWVMQRLGAYSIIRGAADRPSFQMTKKLIVKGKHWLVIFPEGQTIWQNDTVIPFQQGSVQLAFKACEEAEKTTGDGSLYCVPISIKYAYLTDMTGEIEESLAGLEAAIFAEYSNTQLDQLERLRLISEAVLEANERKHNVTPEEDASFTDRIQAMKERVVSRLEAQLEVTPRPEQKLLDRIRTLFNIADKIISEEPGKKEYERKLLQEQQNMAQDLYSDLWRVLQFIAIYGDYVKEFYTTERFMDALCLLEMEVFGKRHMWGPRKAMIKVGEPINLKDRIPEYREGKQACSQSITNELESSVKAMLEELALKIKK